TPRGRLARRRSEKTKLAAGQPLLPRRSVVGQGLAEVDAERAELAVEVRALHADPLRELSDLPAAEQQLLLQVRPLEALARLAERHREQILLDQQLVARRGRRQ